MAGAALVTVLGKDGSGYGDGDGDGYGGGHGYGSGSGYGYGSGYGDGDGDGYGGGHGYGSGSGSGYGGGYGSGSGSGSGYGYGYGGGYGSGYGDGYGGGSGSGSGSGSGYGDGDGYGWPLLLESYRSHELVLAEQAAGRDVFLAWWRSGADGLPANGGRGGEPAIPGLVQQLGAPLRICGPGGLHATSEPDRWAGDRIWAVALCGETIVQDGKAAASRRVILAEITPAQ